MTMTTPLPPAYCSETVGSKNTDIPSLCSTIGCPNVTTEGLCDECDQPAVIDKYAF